MITGCQMREVRIKLEQETAIVDFHFYHVTDQGILPGAWSRNATLTVPRDHQTIRAICDRVSAYLGPHEKSVWEHFPELSGIRITRIEFIRHKGGMTSLAVFYDRLDKAGKPVMGFEGETLWDVFEDRARWYGGNRDVTVDEITQMTDDFFTRCEAMVNRQILGIAR